MMTPDPEAHLRAKQRALRKTKATQFYVLVDERQARTMAIGTVPAAVRRQLVRALTPLPASSVRDKGRS